MIIKLLSFIKHNFIKCAILFLFFLSSNSYSQCAGTDATVTICNIQDPANKNINLFSLLGGTPTTGGVWVDNSKPLEESIFDGMLDAQTLRNSGVYTYTYVQDPSVCTNNTATITINIGPYAGVPSPSVSTCNDVESFNLFSIFDGTKVAPQQNGTWRDNNGVALSGSMVNPKALGVGTYFYTYTIPALGSCPQQSATISVSVFRKPIPGIPSDLIICSTDNLAAYADLNLNTRLQGQDAGGRWTENKTATNELTSLNDNRINVQNIYNTLGAGIYSFTYTVLSNNPICTDSQSVVQIIIDKPLDFTGATLVVNSDICENEIATATYRATLKRGLQPIPDGNYDVTYSINNGTTVASFLVNGDFLAGDFIFSIDRINLPVIGNYTFSITNIRSTTSLNVCTNILGNISDVLTISPLPQINSATVKIDPVCKGLLAQGEISGNTNLTNGNYRITYNLSGDNTFANQQLNLTVTNGVGLFTIPANLVPNAGVNTNFTITNITNSIGCTNTATLSKVFTVKPLPNVSTVVLSINNICVNKDATIQLSGLGSLTNITLDYALSGVNVLSNQSVTLVVNAGNGSFTIPASRFTNAGNTIFTLNSILDNTNGCAAVVSNKTQPFSVSAIPANPVSNNFNFCKNDLSTIASLTPNGAQYQWFDSVSSTTPLTTTTLLITGTYYVKEVNSTGCESGRTAVSVTINTLDSPTLDTDGQNFCALDQPTIQDLSDKTNASGVLYWFDAAANGNQLTQNTLLTEGMTYYGYNFSTATNCYSDALEVTVSLSNCNVTPDFFIPDGFSPNGDQVNDVFRIPKIEFIYPDFTLEIYNRYGNLMFKGNRDKPEWSGRNSDYNVGIDGIAPNGVYFYVLQFNKGDKKPVQGRLYLNR